MSIEIRHVMAPFLIIDLLKGSGSSIATTLSSAMFEILIPKESTLSPEDETIVCFNFK